MLAAVLAACATTPPARAPQALYGTQEPFASEAVYFVLTDRFVNGDPANDHRDQGGAWASFDRPVHGPDGRQANIGYLGGDFRGVLDNAGYIRAMGFTAVWITPIVDNPDAAFSGGKPVEWGSFWTDQGKTGYHGYWGVNFYQLDEHLPSEGLDFAAFTDAMHAQELKVVLDIVGNHGPPAFTMPEPQPEFGKVYDADGRLIADHQNLHPSELDPANEPLHRFFRTEPEIAELASFDDANPEVMDYLAGAYLQWLRQGADALRIDTIGWMPHAFWAGFAERMRRERPGLFMFGEDFRWQAEEIAPHTLPENGPISVLDFPLKAQLEKVFADGGSFESLDEALFLEGGPYRNPYELMTFYDNHDMPRMNATDAGFVDAHNWLFTARGIPVVYYGSEVGFERGSAEHAGNRNYFGQERIRRAPAHPIHQALTRVAQLRRGSVALQRGLQLNLRLDGDEAAFYRVYAHEGVHEAALVLLNKGDAPRTMAVRELLQPGTWRDGFSDARVTVGDRLEVTVPAHGIRVFFFEAPLTRPDLLERLDVLMRAHAARG